MFKHILKISAIAMDSDDEQYVSDGPSVDSESVDESAREDNNFDSVRRGNFYSWMVCQ